MKLAVDFHIHTALSPCADEDMTPNNIINMCVIKGLDAIAITDHNSVENCKSCMEIGKDKNILVIPGMEIQTKEEVHLICLFQNLDRALSFQEIVYNRLPNKKNIPGIFGRQLVFDAKDQVMKENERMLISSVNMTIEEVFHQRSKREFIIIPAHIDRPSFSLIGTLGFIPMGLPIKTLEVSKSCDIDQWLEKHRRLKKYNILQNSDAHYLWDILERQSFVEVKEKSIQGVIDGLDV